LTPKYNGTHIEPDQLLKNAEYKRKSARDARDAAGRARKADKIAAYKKAAEGYDREADTMQAAFDAWATENPEAAATYRAEPKPAPATAAAVSADAVPGLKVTYNSQHNGIELRFDGRPADDVTSRIKAAGFKWSGRQKLWYAPKTEARQRVADELAGNKADINSQRPASRQADHQKAYRTIAESKTSRDPLQGFWDIQLSRQERNDLSVELGIDVPLNDFNVPVSKYWHELDADEQNKIREYLAADIIKAAAASGVKGADELAGTPATEPAKKPSVRQKSAIQIS